MWPQWTLAIYLAFAVGALLVKSARDPDWQRQPWAEFISTAMALGLYVFLGYALISGGFFAGWLR